MLFARWKAWSPPPIAGVLRDPGPKVAAVACDPAGEGVCDVAAFDEDGAGARCGEAMVVAGLASFSGVAATPTGRTTLGEGSGSSAELCRGSTDGDWGREEEVRRWSLERRFAFAASMVGM